MLYSIIFLFFVIVAFLLHILKYKSAPRIFLYHNVSDEIPSKKTNISIAKFEQHIKILQKLNFKFCKINDLFDATEMQNSPRRAFITFDDSLETLYHNVFPILQKYNVKATIYVCKKIQGQKLLTKEQIQTMQKSGLLEFGSHTSNHINLLEYSDYIVNEDLNQSKKFVEEITLSPCNSFAYPYGKYDESHFSMLSNAGYTSALIIGKKLENYDKVNKFAIPRIEPRGNMNIVQFIILLILGKFKI